MGKLRVPPPRADVVPTVAAAIVRGLQADPATRWPTMDALLEVLASSSGHGEVQAEAWARGLVAALALLLGVSVFVVAFVMYESPATNSAQGVLYALTQWLIGLAVLPFAYHRLRRPRQRALIHFGLVMFTASLVTRLACWRADFTSDASSIAETLVYAAAYATYAAASRQRWILLTLPILLGSLALHVELGASPLLLPIAWLVSVSLALFGLRHDARLSGERSLAATERNSSS